MKGFVDDIEDLTESNKDFRLVLYTGQHLQLVLMALKPGEDIGEEVHADRDQFFRVEKGRGEALIDGKRTKVKSGTPPRPYRAIIGSVAWGKREIQSRLSTGRKGTRARQGSPGRGAMKFSVIWVFAGRRHVLAKQS